MQLKKIIDSVFSFSPLESLINRIQKKSPEFMTITGGCFRSKRLFKKITPPGKSGTIDQLSRLNPRRTDVLLIGGNFTHYEVTKLKKFYRKIPRPCRVAAIGSCAISGGMFNSYNSQQGIDELLPVDVYIPGCPPSVSAIENGLQELKKHIENTDIKPPFKNSIPGENL